MTVYGDIRDVLVALPHGDPDGGTAYVKSDLFPVRHEIIRQLQPAPRSVFEFGTLYGYFLVTAIDALGGRRGGLDTIGWIDDESHTRGSNRMCEANLMATLSFAFNLMTIWWSTNRDDVAAMYARDTRGRVPQFDLISVDSDHTYHGCLADLHAAHQLAPRWIFVDDWTNATHTDDIQEATTAFRAAIAAREPGVAYELTEYETVNGLAVLTRKELA